MPPAGFDARKCPLCGGSGTPVLTVEAAEFCRTNNTYAADFRERLALPDPAFFPIDRCHDCGFVYAGSLPPPEFLEKLYESVIEREPCIEGSENRSGYMRRLRYVAELLELAPPAAAHALDFGSGLGVTLRIFESVGVAAIGFDPSALRREYSTVAVTSSLDELRAAAPFTIVVLDNVLEHVPDPRQTIELIASLTAPQGVAYVSVPPYESEFLQRQIDAQQSSRPLDMTLNPWEHLNYFDAGSLDRTLAFGGFRRIERAEIGLRNELQAVRRMKNAAASALRLLRWGALGRGVVSAEHAFYRRR